MSALLTISLETGHPRRQAAAFIKDAAEWKGVSIEIQIEGDKKTLCGHSFS